MEDEKILERLGFKYNKDKKYWYKAIIPSGDPRGKRYVLYFRDGEFWTAPKMAKDHVEFLGEVMLYNAHKEGKIDISSVDLNNPIPIVIDERQYYAELSLTPEEAEQQFSKAPEKKERKNAEEDNHYKIIAKLTDYDILEIFSDSGTGKSKIAWAIAYNSLQHGHTVFYYDTERNISSEFAKKLGDSYHYDPSPLRLISFKKKLPKVDLLVIDSIGMPFLIRYADMGLNERGNAILELISFMGALKEWCIRNNSVAIVTNQPTSEMTEMKKDAVRKPWGGKAFHIAKEVVKPELVYSTPDETSIILKAFRMREYGKDTEIATVLITPDGVKIKWKIGVE